MKDIIRKITTSKHKKWIKRGLAGLAVVAIVGLGVSTYYFYRQFENLKADPETIAQQEAESIKARLGKFMQLPDETPAVATVTDKDKLQQDQPFFKDAENGDKLIVFNNTQQVFLYRPSTGKVINSAHLTLKDPAGTE